jgi:hypothetical protein
MKTTRPKPGFPLFSLLSGVGTLGLLGLIFFPFGCAQTDADIASEALFAQELRASFATYTIPKGAHSALVSDATPGNPLAWFTTVAGRDYVFRFDSSAAYVITHPVEPSDQFDFNKLPGLSDCGTLDLSVNGAMFGWRFRLDKTPRVVEVTAYANNNGKHLTPVAPMFVLDEAELAALVPIRYRVYLDGGVYRFEAKGSVAGRSIDAATTLPRACSTTSHNKLKWASGLYFGGTSTAPSNITGTIAESPFRK